MKSAGKFKNRYRVIHACCALLFGAATASVFAASGQFTYVIGNVSVQSGGRIIQAMRGTEVNSGDLIVTGDDGMAQLAMIDQAKISLRSRSQLRVEQYPQSAESRENSVLTLVRGTMRAFTTLLAKDRVAGYKMQTRVATVGIRGSGNILNHSDDDTTTTNHTIEGSHIVEARDSNFAPIITNPNQTVQVVLGQAPKIIPTPPNLLDAGKIMVGGGSASGSGNASGEPPPQQSGGTTIGSTIVGGNGLGYTLVDATGNLGADPINLQNIVIAARGSAFSDQAIPGQIVLDAGTGALRAYTAYAGGQSGTSLNITGGSAADLQTITIGGSTTVVLGRIANATGLTFSGSTGVVNGGSIHFGYAGSGFPAFLSDVLTGSVSYTRAGATSPTNQFGTTGQLTSSILDVNFTARTLNATLGISMPATNGNSTWTMQASNVPFALNSFLAFTGGGRLVVTNGTGQSSTSNGNLNGTLEGSFVGSTLNGALVGYGLVDQTTQNFQSVSGVVAFSGPSQNAAAQFRDGIISDATGALGGASYIRSFVTTNRPEEVTIDAQGRASAFAGPYVSGNQLVGHLAYAQGSAAVIDNGFDATTGLSWGRWSGGSATVGGQTASLANASLHYIFGAAQAGPVSLPLTGTANYDVVGSTRPTDSAGRVGTMNSATLDANFSARTVNASVNVGINGQTWNGSANAMPIYRDQYFSAYGGSSIAGVPRPAQFVMTCAPSCTPQIAAGSLDGFFTGRTGSGAGLMYNMNGIGGAVAFGRRGG